MLQSCLISRKTGAVSAPEFQQLFTLYRYSDCRKVGKAGAFLQSACFLLPKADRAEAGRTSGAGLPQPLQRDIPEAVRADRGADRFLRHPIGDQRLLAADVGAVMAGAAEGR